MDKLKELPPVNVITVEEHPERLESVIKKFKQYNVVDIVPHIYKKYKDGDCNISGEFLHKTPISTRGAVTSHLKTIKKWYTSTSDPVGFFCEDDISLDTVEYWNFNWNDFYQMIPKNFGAVQLVLIKEFDILPEELGFRKRNWSDWSACAYVMTRSYAKKILDAYHRYDNFTFDYVGIDLHKRKIPCYEYTLIPVSENILFSLLEPVYVAPLFLEDVKNFSTLTQDNDGLVNKMNTVQGLGHHESYEFVLNWWKSGGLNIQSMRGVDDVFI